MPWRIPNTVEVQSQTIECGKIKPLSVNPEQTRGKSNGLTWFLSQRILFIPAEDSWGVAEWLSDCSLYVTIEPCSMCAGALVLSRIKNIIFGAPDTKTGACGSIINIVNHKKLNHHIKITKGILAKESSFLLREFFKKKRVKNSHFKCITHIF